MRDIFKKPEDSLIVLHFYECEEWITLEELYQAFKVRMLEELSAPGPIQESRPKENNHESM